MTQAALICLHCQLPLATWFCFVDGGLQATIYRLSTPRMRLARAMHVQAYEQHLCGNVACPQWSGCCVQGIEAALYALLMSVSNLGSGAAGLSAAGLIAWLGITATNFSMLWLLLLLLILPNLLSLLTLPYLPRQALGFDKPEVVQQEHQLA